MFSSIINSLLHESNRSSLARDAFIQKPSSANNLFQPHKRECEKCKQILKLSLTHAAKSRYSPPVCHDSIPGHQVSYQRFWENRWIPDSLPTSPRPRRKPTLVDTDRHPAMYGPRPHINKKRHSSSMSFYESHRRRPSNPHRTLTERLMSLSASAPKALKLSVGPRPNNSLRSYKLIRSGDFRLFPPANFANSAILPTDKISTFFMQNFLPKKPKDSSL